MNPSPNPARRERAPVTRSYSLRARVALAAALGAVVVAAVVAAILVVLLTRREVAQQDRRLSGLADVLATRIDAEPARPAVIAREARLLLRGQAGGLIVTVRDGGAPRTAGTIAAPPDLPAVDGDATVRGQDYRVQTASLASGGTVTVGLPETAIRRAVNQVRLDTVLVALAAAAGAAGLGWLLAGRALRPMRVLRDRTAALPGQPGPEQRAALAAGTVRTATETAELADALAGLLERVDDARAERERALQAARDFAAAASHELRTPLTTLRTDLDVLQAHRELPPEQWAAVVGELLGSAERMETTLTALGQLAAGDLGGDGAVTRVDLADVAAQAVAAARRRAPAGTVLTVGLPEEEVPVLGSEPGLRLAVDNLVLNALRHSGGRLIGVTVSTAAGQARLSVDDDGVGVPPEERARVFDRFARGRAAQAPGSGLGLALVAQQAGLHGGRAWLDRSPLGGARAVLELPLALERNSGK